LEIWVPAIDVFRLNHSSQLDRFTWAASLYGRDHERHFPDRGRAFHFDWNALKGARDLGNAQPMREV
jgi:hypothetical protein